MEQVTIERLGHQGDGIAPGPVFVPGTLPGEVVEGVIDGGRMAAPRIVTPVDTRVKPPCRHAKSCGGCQLQHARDDFVADWKTGVVRHALAAHGLDTEFRPIAVSPPQSRRRASFSARRTRKGALAGFHMKGSDVIVSVPDCLLVQPELAQALPLVEALSMLGGSRKGELSVTLTVSATGLDAHVSGGKPLDPTEEMQLAELARRHGCARIAWDDEVMTLRPAQQAMGAARVVPPPGAFLQATPQGETALLGAVTEIVGTAAHVVDLFAGCGTFALPLAEKARVHAVEGDRAMTVALDKGWRMAQGLRLVTTEVRDLFREPLIAEDLTRFDAAVIDPPRAGAEAQCHQLARAAVPRIAHVSCNPVTFARDAATLVAAGYTLDWVQVVDQFRWSTHVELAAAFTHR
ncbi:RNA methyltransferase [Salipiger aestuarii]|uniref:23S rRNA (Uracil1939-C5)-methyltransferase n=1 Tax=Salipiger aestuarii TaxID=568098 RepID=A0A327YTW5_9RHOB|nr:class I SAM-dependent RNA methyltransferase [Salipiger aestuarii]EIE50092.1 23S rRNA (Uracil-5-)-methyltransferase rumA [Citreicella sp. 357]KAA8609882.1 RNA methyltransferase [Salipiger aestuarii]KAB2543140.1 RNA methyltransferase [Salipiger aestuarii]RAK21459.1 23S rRNA (uracil1939-C5)-methyltransferase [Salipiger aestuarii]